MPYNELNAIVEELNKQVKEMEEQSTENYPLPSKEEFEKAVEELKRQGKL